MLIVAAVPARAGDAGRIAIVDYGIYTHRVDRFEAEPKHISGERVIVSNVVLLRQADLVDAQLGRMIGFQFRVTDPALVGQTLTIRRLVPPLTNPKTGKTATTVERDIVVAQVNQLVLNAYRFDYDWEMAEGLWRFQVLYKGRVIAEKVIKVVVALN
ncbi:MAG: DUF3859 domain-containing protein [Rhodospirillaceae bacterium]|nr:DUF3859 domain-containing protein [Rhodospirillaceae bacterium]